jgi:Integral membrane protein, interacts with FtsH
MTNNFPGGSMEEPRGFPTAERALMADNAILWSVYRWMTFGLALTGFVALFIPQSIAIEVAKNPMIFFGLLVGELVLVMIISLAVNRISAATATLLFLVYATLNGLTFSIFFLAYQLGSIAQAFFVTAGTFGAMSAWGYFTKRDLTGVGHFAIMGLFGLIIASIVNIFWANSTLYWVCTYAGVLIFTLLTAYDTQKIKRLGMAADASSEQGKKIAIQGALTLYLDFINLFLNMLRIMGKRR